MSGRYKHWLRERVSGRDLEKAGANKWVEKTERDSKSMSELRHRVTDSNSERRRRDNDSYSETESEWKRQSVSDIYSVHNIY